ncbi:MULTISPECIES: S8/S53 family peptidase [unclassified Pseudomonas]|uniref:S8/S53 family peptidase n=1 Tax=unclassified Pseudomonas TaxID=196821 RepID=UPI002447A7EB|nr:MULTISPECIES: S8/S53 family peptidase [unclassified Pseudomonas]MDH0301533.1 S8/S53 family peptidase [Pseudomonas sp. GD04091]MDH1985427.1 S8/S53 family peptidase [Pseudomonas sp. GD03689]
MRPLWLLGLTLTAAVAGEPGRALLPTPDASAFRQLREEIDMAEREIPRPPDQLDSGVLVSFEGGNVGQTLARVMLGLNEDGKLPSARHTVQAGETLCGLLDQRGYPPPCPPLLEVVHRLNPERSTSQPLQVGEVLSLPTLTLWPAIARKPVVGVASRKAGDCQPGSDGMFTYWSRLEPEVVSCLPSSTVNPQPVSIVQYRAYQFVVPTETDEATRQLRAALERSKTTNVRFDVIPHPSGAELRQYAESGPGAPNTCAEGLSDETPFNYIDLFDYDSDAMPAVHESLSPDGVDIVPRVVPVVLIDTPVEKSPNLYPAYSDTKPTQPLTCNWKSPFTNKFHGTHLAGLIASQGYGFRSISTNAAIVSHVWNVVKADGELAEASNNRNYTLRQRLLRNAYPKKGFRRAIYVAASSFSFYNLTPTSDQLDNESLRWQEPLLDTIRSYSSLFVVAAGQSAKEGEPPVKLTNVSTHLLQSLGDQRNVIVVTACSDCRRDKTTLLPSANFGTGSMPIVQVAAPGGQAIPGWVSTDNVSSARGTSQATALVASVAAAMLGTRPEVYDDPQWIKTRLQVTSRPIAPNADGTINPDAAKIATGVVDPVLALLDPDKHWLKEGGEWKAVKIRRIEPEYILFTDKTGAPAQIRRDTLARILTLPGKRQVAYVDSTFEGASPPGTIRRVGPSQVNEGFVTLCDSATALPLANVQDLIISLQGVQDNECI